MTDQLLAYLLDDLNADERSALEARLATDQGLRAQLDCLRDCLAQGDDDCRRCGDVPPEDLVHRTVKFVEESDDDWSEELSRAKSAQGFTPAHETCSARRRWSLLDCSIAAAVALAVLSLAMPAMRGARDSSRQLGCQNNLYWLGKQLFQFQERRGHELPPIAANEPAGVYVLQLVSRGGVDPRELAAHLICPESQLAERRGCGPVRVTIPTPQQWQSAPRVQLAALARQSGGDYACRIGYYDPQGVYRTATFTGSCREPLLADAPQAEAAGNQNNGGEKNAVRSAHHAGGQNVLYQSLCVRFSRECTLPETNDHIYLNAAGQQAAGQDAADVVLVAADRTPRGPLDALGPALLVAPAAAAEDAAPNGAAPVPR